MIKRRKQTMTNATTDRSRVTTFRSDFRMRRMRTRGDTAYLLDNPVMTARLRRSLDDARNGRMREFTLEELARWPDAEQA
jgi:predicted aminopeptidase